ncbi:MAG TPA: carboxypeptidase regulatory-like domain-containing protein [Vicinamibacterales bacterium]|nr:carboxypeptidase regulatory-like domain-containing protein [Vicinamibacterales bacterium]
MKFYTVYLALVLCLLAGAASAQSQGALGQITGRIDDQSQAVLPGVAVKATNPATGLTREAVTDAEGIYTISLLPSGTYDVTAELQGFQGLKAEGVVVTVGSSITVNLAMRVGSVSESVTVMGQASAVETTAPRSSVTLDATAIEKLPINGRRFQDLVVLTPNAQVDTSRGQIALSGQRGINTNVNIDGQDYNQPFFGGIRGGERSNSAPTIPQAAIQEFQVIAAGYSAEYGRSSGGLVNVVTKSGSNSVRGSAFYSNRYDKWASKNVFDQKAAPTQQQFGGGAGGPIRRDKLFFFAAYEQQVVTVPRAVLFDTLSGFSPTSETAEAYNFYKPLEVPYEQTNDAMTWLTRVDAQLNSSNRLTIRYSGSINEAKNGVSVGQQLFSTITNALSNNGTEKGHQNTVVGQWTRASSSRMLSDIRGQFAKEVRPRLANAEQPNLTTNIGRTGTVNFLPTTQYDWRFQGQGNVAWQLGHHSIKTGAEFSRTYANQQFAFNQFGLYSISGTSTPTILELMSVGGTTQNRLDSTTVTYLRQLGNGLVDYYVNTGAVFIEDSWRPRPDVTISAGVRWDGQWNPTPPTTNTALVNTVRNFVFPGGRVVDPGQIPDMPNQWGPRLGFAWDPMKDGRMVVRGFTGIYYATTPGLLLAGSMGNFRTPAGDLSVQLPIAGGGANNTVYKQLLAAGINLNNTSLNNLPNVTPENIQQIVSALGLSFDPNAGVQPIAFDRDFKNPESYQAGIGVEKQLGAGFTVGADYSQVRTINLQRNHDINLPVPIIRANDPAKRPFFGLLSGTSRPLASLGSVQLRESSARSMFRALTIRTTLKRAYAQVNAFYVLSKSLSDDDNERDSGGPSAENQYDFGPEYNDARLDRRHQFTGGIVFFLPYQVQVASGFQLRSGLPVDAAYGSDANEDRITTPNRPFSAPGVPFKRNAFRNRPTYDSTLHLEKGVNFATGKTAAIVLDVFNVFNFSNIQYAGSQVLNYCATTSQLDCGFAGPSNVNFLQLRDQNPASARAGQYLLNNTAGAPRQVQLGFRYSF